MDFFFDKCAWSKTKVNTYYQKYAGGRGDTGLVEYSLVYEQVHTPCGNGLNTKSVRCARQIAVQCVRMGMGLEYFDTPPQTKLGETELSLLKVI